VIVLMLIIHIIIKDLKSLWILFKERAISLHIFKWSLKFVNL